MPLSEIPYPRISPDIVKFGDVTIRWYGVSYVIAFVLAWIVLRDLARRKRWPVEPAKVSDVLFWGILGVFVGGRLGWVLFYGLPSGTVHTLWDWFKVWEGGMSFHGGLLGVIVAYWIYVWRTGKPRGEFFDGLSLATPLGIFCVRMGNFINAELWGVKWDGPWAMRFPRYDAPPYKGPAGWEAAYARNPEDPRLFEPLRHPSQLYEALFEGLVLYLVLRWLMLRRGVGGGRIAATFLVAYGAARFLVEFVREPDADLGRAFLGVLTRGQQLSFGMVVAGLVTFAVCAWKTRRRRAGA